MGAADSDLPPVTPPEQLPVFQLLRFSAVSPDREQIARLCHLRAGREAHRRWFDLLDDLSAKLPRLMRPRAVLRIDEVAIQEPRRLVLSSGVEFEGEVGTFLAHCTHVATFLATIGSAAERLARGWLRAGRVMPGTLADAIASESVEAVVQEVVAHVRAWAATRGQDVTPPYSPGYCGIALTQQVPLLGSLPGRQINVRLTPSCLMVPVKSVSGLIGIGPADKVSAARHPCEGCDHETCTQRRAPRRGKGASGGER